MPDAAHNRRAIVLEALPGKIFRRQSLTVRMSGCDRPLAGDQPGPARDAGSGAVPAVPGSVCVWIAAGDVFTHGWDLAKATGQPTDLEPDVAARLLAQIEPILPDTMRGPDGEAAFGPRVEIASSAPAADQLAAFEGRHP